MKRSKFAEEQIAYALRQAESGTPVGDVCRQVGVSEATFYAWRGSSSQSFLPVLSLGSRSPRPTVSPTVVFSLGGCAGSGSALHGFSCSCRAVAPIPGSLCLLNAAP